MFKSIGAVLVLWYLSSLFSGSVGALDDTLATTFRALEAEVIRSSSTRAP